MSKKESRRQFLKEVGALSAAAIAPGLFIESASANTETAIQVSKKKAASKKKVAKKKVAKKKVAKKKVPNNHVVYCDQDECGHYVYEKPGDGKPTVSVPEPSALGLLTIGLGALAYARKKNKKKENSDR
jgi:predicted house-cleaning NTP pyrophosphatase (Maf/HAM1 superfamily)